MLNRRKCPRVDVGLEGTIRFHANSYAVDCVISNISEKVIGAMITASDPVYAEGDVDLFIYVSPDELPVKCTGRVVWYSMDKERPKDYTAGVVVDYISGIDRKRLESVM
jgi:hypothetical protein